MASVQILPLCFLFVTTQGSSKFSAFKCEEKVAAELGKAVNITCENNEMITNATVTFCSNKTNCPNKSDLSSIRNKYITDNGRITLILMNRSVILTVHKVQISDQRYYNFYLDADNGDDHTKYTYLKVVATCSEPQIKNQEDSVVCTVSRVYPQRQLYWCDDHGTNLTHNSELVSSKNEDGSFSLISTLQWQSLDSDKICCSIFNNNTNCDKLQGSACVDIGNKPTTNEVSQEAEKKIIIPVLLVVVLAAICAITVFCCIKKKGPKRQCVSPTDFPI